MEQAVTKRTREAVALLWLERFGPLATHQFNQHEFTGYSDNTIATGLSILARWGKVEGKYQGRYKVWQIANKEIA